MKISVIIPTYNRKKTLARAIQSVINQSLSPFEILIVDDGSNDGTEEWVKDNFQNIKYIYQNNHGVSSARNIGIENAYGDWVAFLDSDDEWLPNKLYEQVKAIDSNPEIKFFHTNEIWIRNGIRVNQMKKHKKYGGYIFEKCLDICRISPSSALIQKEVFDNIGIFDESLRVCEDYDLWLRITSKYPVVFLDVPLIYKYGGHADQLSKVNDGIESYRIQSLEKIIKSGLLSDEQKVMAVNVLVNKMKIYSKGLEKRKKLAALQDVKKSIQYWINML
tara:strand:- start:20 stop:847 length:828 start_codon:yes stop_codon:yes gene_type:complete